MVSTFVRPLHPPPFAHFMSTLVEIWRPTSSYQMLVPAVNPPILYKAL